MKGISNQFQDAINRIERLRWPSSAYQEQLQIERTALRLLQTLDVLFECPILNIRQLESALGVAFRTSQGYVERLLDIDILLQVTDR